MIFCIKCLQPFYQQILPYNHSRVSELYIFVCKIFHLFTNWIQTHEALPFNISSPDRSHGDGNGPA